MSVEKAIQSLRMHAGHVDTKGKISLVSSFRPFRGLQHRCFGEVVVALAEIFPIFCDDKIDCSLVHAGWDICSRLRYFALNEDSTLRRNGLLDEESIATIRIWERCIEMFFLHAMQKLDLLTCLSYFLENFVDLHRDTRIACAMLAPILDKELIRQEYEDETVGFVERVVEKINEDAT